MLKKIVLGLTISKQNYLSHKVLLEIYDDPYDNSGIDINQLSENEKSEILSILRGEFKKV